MLSFLAPKFPAPPRLMGLLLALSCALSGFAAETTRPNAADGESAGVEDPTTMAAFTVRADRLEEFGFRMHAYLDLIPGGTPSGVWVVEVLPNTAAAKAGLRPGDEITKIDGRRWRDEGRGAPAVLGELPPIASVVDVTDVRVFADETTAIVFELPVRGSGAAFPADKFQALFRVNKTQRAFEDFSVKLRESVRVAGVAKVTEAGLEVRFQTPDPALAPQPVQLKAGGGVRVLLVKFSRSFETTRTDFKRVVPFEETTW